MDWTGWDKLLAEASSLPETQRRRLAAASLAFLCMPLEEYVRRNPRVSLHPLPELLASVRSEGIPDPVALTGFAGRFDAIMFDADDTDRWYDITTQDALLYLNDLAERGSAGGGDRDLLTEVLNVIGKIVIELGDLGVRDVDFRDPRRAFAFLSSADRRAIMDKAARLMPAIWAAWA